MGLPLRTGARGQKMGPRALLILLLTWLIGLAPPSDLVTLAFLGDVMVGRGVLAADAPPAEVTRLLRPALSSADFVLANLESPLGGPSTVSRSGYNLCAPPEQLPVLTEAGFDLLSVTNNHRLDCGPSGTEVTRALLASAGIEPLGPEGHVDRVVGRLRLTFLALDDVSSALSLDRTTDAVRMAHEGGGIVVVSIHWGGEYKGAPDERQLAIAHALIGAGAALIWGHHPHVLQPAERIPCRMARRCLVLYSLGNAIFDQQGLADTRRSALLLVRIDRLGVIDARAVPFMIDVQHGRLQAATAAEAADVFRRLGPHVGSSDFSLDP